MRQSSALGWESLDRPAGTRVCRPLSGVSFQNEHVYKTQLLIQFLDFIIGRSSIPLPAGYIAASANWLAGYVVGVDPNHHYIVNGHTLWQELSTSYGGSGGQGLANIAILDSGINLVKGNFFGLKNPDPSIEPTQTRTQIKYRNVSTRIVFFMHQFLSRVTFRLDNVSASKY